MSWISAHWDWGIAGFILAAIALVVAVMTLPTAFQMFWGAPKILFEFVENDLEEGIRQLQVYISNAPIRLRTLRKMGIIRTPVDIWADFSIYESGTNRLLKHLQRPILMTDKEKSLQVTLPHTISPAVFIPIIHDPKRAYVSPFDDEAKTYLSLGKYYIEMTVGTSAQQSYDVRKEFVIGEKAKNSFWL